MTGLVPLKCSHPVYAQTVGTGGIGSGIFFLLEGNHSLTRNESRAGKLLPYRDYCKQHIILHYVSVLMGAATGGMEVYPIGKVGDDEQGRRLLAEMDGVGMRTMGVEAARDSATLFSVCFQYPDSAGGNITTSNGASSLVRAPDIERFFRNFQPRGAGMALAAPEVPLDARIALLREGRRRGWFNAASILAEEAEGFAAMGGLGLSDLLSVNRDEAAALAGIADESPDIQFVVQGCMEVLFRHNPSALLIVTDGPGGSWGCRKGKAVFVPPLAVTPVSTAGAGDAFFAGTLAGLASGLPFAIQAADRRFGETPLDSAIELGTLLASLSVTSPDTIHWQADAAALRRHAETHGIPLSARFGALLG